MSREFLAAIALEVWFQLLRVEAGRQGAVVSREVFVHLPVYPILTPYGAAQLFAANLPILGVQTMAAMPQNRPALPHFERN